MKSYLLLRDNNESGPYTLENFRKKGLQPADLIWVEGESSSWKFPAEFDELRGLVKTPAPKPVQSTDEQAAPGVKVIAMQSTNKDLIPKTPEPEVDYSSYLKSAKYEEDEREIFSDFKLQSTHRKSFSLASNLIALLVLAIGVAMTAYVVRSIVLSFGGESLQSAQATEIQAVNFEAEHAAYAAKPDAQAATVTTLDTPVADEVATPETQNPAKEKETSEPIVTVADKPDAEIKKIEIPEVVKNIPEKIKVVKDTTTVSEKTTVDEKEKTEKEKPAKTSTSKNIRSQMKVSGNDYTVGLLGGISNLVLNVSNNSGTDVESAVVEVVYRNKKDSIVGRKTLQVQGIDAGGSKKLQVPSNSRGVKAEYRIVDVDVKS